VPCKTVLVVQPSDTQEATDMFHDLDVKVVSGSWFLGGFVGEKSLAADFASNKVKVWCNCIEKLSEVAIVEPHLLPWPGLCSLGLIIFNGLFRSVDICLPLFKCY